MRLLFTISFLFVSFISLCQKSDLMSAIDKLDHALIVNDSVELKQVLHDDVSYGHSNGWVQSKQDVINDMASGKLDYLKIKSLYVNFEDVNKEWASVRFTSKVQFKLNGKEMEMDLHVLQIWWKTNKGWQLIARQSTKLP